MMYRQINKNTLGKTTFILRHTIPTIGGWMSSFSQTATWQNWLVKCGGGYANNPRDGFSEASEATGVLKCILHLVNNNVGATSRIRQ
jgi:hypothetical protein